MENWDTIYTYTDDDMVADGALIRLADVPALAPLVAEAGFRVPVVVTRGVWDAAIETSPAAAARGESDAGRAWDLLFVSSLAFQRAAITPDDGFVELTLTATAANGKPYTFQVWGVAEFDPRGALQIKILLPSEY